MDMKPFPDPLYPQSSPEHRYQTDPVFRCLVDMLEASIHRAQFTPSELRDAAMLASIRYENTQVRHIRFVREQEPRP